MPFTKDSLIFLADLAENNDRDWFTPRKEDYKRLVQAPMLELAAELNRSLARFAPEFCTDPQKAVFRVYRDVRFGKDKRPYKTNIAAFFWNAKVAKKSGPGLYLSISPEQVMIAGGLYSPGAPEALLLRQHIARHHERLRELLAAKALRRRFSEMDTESLQRAPKGFSPDHPAIDLLTRKSWVLASTDDGDICLKPRFASSTAAAFESLTPFLQFLDEPFAAHTRRTKDPLMEPRSRPRR